jgi:phosphatidylglycerophosphate synthase
MTSVQDSARAPMRAFLGCAFAGLFVAVALSWLVAGRAQVGAGAIGAGLLFYVVAITIAGVGLVRSYSHAVLGLCNMVTLMRLIMVCVLVIALAAGAAQSWALFAFAIAALSLDGVDGWLARRQKLTSSFGARFDMEVDAAFALVLALLAFSSGVVGVFVLLLGLPSYLFFVAKFVFPWLDNSLPDLFSRKVVCVAQLAVLIALQIPLDIAGLLGPLTIGVSAALVWSFGRDIIWLARTHR